MKPKVVSPSPLEIDFPILKVCTLEVAALKTHLLFGLALHWPVRLQCQHWESYSSRSSGAERSPAP